MSFLIANFGTAASPRYRAVSLDRIASFEPAGEGVTEIHVLKEYLRVPGNGGNLPTVLDVYAKCDFKSLCRDFDDAKKFGTSIDATEITSESFEECKKLAGKAVTLGSAP